MQFVFFIQSLISDWNHGNAHFLRGIITELIYRGHFVSVYEPQSSWSVQNLIHYHGQAPILDFYNSFPHLKSITYELNSLNYDDVLNGADVVIVHEWNSYELVKQVGLHKKRNPQYLLFFHDTHHRSVSDPESIKKYDLANYDGVLAFGSIIKEIYISNSWTKKAWVWHEAADTRIFKKINSENVIGDIVWIGNWGDNERSDELYRYLFNPVNSLNLKCCVYGVRYPSTAQQMLKNSGIAYHGWVPNYRVPQIFSQFKCTVHIPRRPYTAHLPGIPTIRPFEALACGIPLVSSQWDDCEHLFTPGKDFLMASSPEEMKEMLSTVLYDQEFATQLSIHGQKTILARHTCKHRVDELLSICDSIQNIPESYSIN